MKIMLFGKEDLVRSACAEETPLGLCIIINAVTRDCYLYHSGGSFYVPLNTEGRTPIHQAYKVCLGPEDQPDQYDECEVVFVAENDTEAQLLKGIEYNSVCKEQLVSQIIKVEFQKSIRSIGHYPCERLDSEDSPSLR